MWLCGRERTGNRVWEQRMWAGRSLLKQHLQLSAVPSIHCNGCYMYRIIQKFAKPCILWQGEEGQYFSCIFFSQQLTFPGETASHPPFRPLAPFSAWDAFPLPNSHPSRPQLPFSLSLAGRDSAEIRLWPEQTVRTGAGGTEPWPCPVTRPVGSSGRRRGRGAEWAGREVRQILLLASSGKQRMTGKKTLSDFSAGYFCIPGVALISFSLARAQGAAWQMGKGCPGP